MLIYNQSFKQLSIIFTYPLKDGTLKNFKKIWNIIFNINVMQDQQMTCYFLANKILLKCFYLMIALYF